MNKNNPNQLNTGIASLYLMEIKQFKIRKTLSVLFSERISYLLCYLS